MKCALKEIVKRVYLFDEKLKVEQSLEKKTLQFNKKNRKRLVRMISIFLALRSSTTRCLRPKPKSKNPNLMFLTVR